MALKERFLWETKYSLSPTVIQKAARISNTSEGLSRPPIWQLESRTQREMTILS